MTRLIKSFLFFFHPLFSFYFKKRKKGKGRVRVLIFHDLNEDWMKTFEELVSSLVKKYRFISPDDFEKFLAGNLALDYDHLLVSFDDGFKSSKDAINRFLDPHGIKAVVFACSEFIGMDREAGKRFTSYNIYEGQLPLGNVGDFELPMSEEELIELSKNGHKIGSHTANHRRLSKIEKEEDFRIELEESRLKLESLLKRPVNWLAYPFGTINSIDQKSMKYVKENYQYCFSGIRGFNCVNTNQHLVRRESVHLKESSDFCEFIAIGGLSPFYAFQRKKLSSFV